MKPTQTTGAAGTGSGTAGTSGSAGTSGGGSSGVGTGGVGNSGFDASIDISTADSKSDGVCAATMTAAEPLPLDLYVTVDLSKSMALTISGTTTKWDAVKTALNTFFSDSQSAGLGAGLGYFPLVQSAPPPAAWLMERVARTGRAIARKTCVSPNSSTTVVVPLCVDSTTCTNGQNCVIFKDCGNANYCAQDGTPPTPCSASCMDYAGYCHARDVCDATAYATPVVADRGPSGSATGQAATLMTSLGQHTPDGYTPTGPRSRARSSTPSNTRRTTRATSSRWSW